MTDMDRVDIDIYINQLVRFFESNPNDLMDLIGELDKDEFYTLLKEQATLNYDKGEDITLTQHQIIEIVVKLKKVNVETHKMVVIVDKVFQSTSFGMIGLN
jgi:hypothetical protein